MIRYKGTYPAYDDSIILTKLECPALPSVQHDTVRIPCRPGNILTAHNHGERKIRATFELNGKNAMRNATLAAQLIKWAASSEPAQLILDETPDRYFLAQLTDATAPDYAAQYPTITLTFTCDNPYSFALEWSAEQVGREFWYLGTVAVWPVIVLQPQSKVENPSWSANGRMIELSGLTIVPGDDLIIDNANRKITINGQNAMPYLTLDSDWLYMHPGITKIEGSCGKVVWRDVYL